MAAACSNCLVRTRAAARSRVPAAADCASAQACSSPAPVSNAKASATLSRALQRTRHFQEMFGTGAHWIGYVTVCPASSETWLMHCPPYDSDESEQSPVTGTTAALVAVIVIVRWSGLIEAWTPAAL